MNDLLEFLTSKEIIIVYFIAILACFICIVVYIIEKNNDKYRKKHNTRELNKLVDIIKEKYPTKDEEKYYDEPVLTVVKEETPIVEMIDEHDKTLEKDVIDVQKINITHYEEEQERTAIISLDELLKKSKEMYEANELTQYQDEGNEPISIQDLEERVDKKTTLYEDNFEIDKVVPVGEVEEEILQMDDFNTISNDTVDPVVTEKKFKSSPIISPIYGIEKEVTSSKSIKLENTADYDKLDEEIRKTDELSMSLKELQEKLE